MRIRARAVELTPALEEHIERRLAFALGRFEPRIESVTVTISETPATGGGTDTCCLVRVRLLGTEVVSEDRGADVVVAVDQASERAARAVAREVGRRPAR